MSINPSDVVLEEVLRRAMDEALELAEKPVLNDGETGALMAYFTILDWGKQQAEMMGIRFGDKDLQSFDPYSLLIPKKAA